MPNLSHLILPPSADFAALEGVLQNLEGIALICEGQNLLGNLALIFNILMKMSRWELAVLYLH